MPWLLPMPQNTEHHNPKEGNMTSVTQKLINAVYDSE